MTKTKYFLLYLLFVGILLASCTPTAVTSPTSVGSQEETLPALATPAVTEPVRNGEKTVVNAAIAALMQELNIDANQVKIVAVEAVEWPNACLGVQKPDEMCAEVITQGFKITLQAGGKTYEYHTNQDGSQIRRVEDAEQAPTPGQAQTESPVSNLPAAANAAQQALAQQLGVAVEEIQVARVERVEWPNGCLGIEQPGTMCTQAIVPGYRVILEAGGKQYEFRTDESGRVVLPAEAETSAPLPEIIGSVIVWEQTEGSACSRAEIGAQSVAYGECGSTLAEAPLAGSHMEELNFLLATYAQFSEETKAGRVDFKGSGSHEPSVAEKRSIAEWAALVYAEFQSGQSDADAGLAFNWHREGGIAGFCDDLTVYRSGWALPSSCKSSGSQAAETYRLSPGELEKLYAWIDQLEGFDYEHKDAAAADAMLVSLSLAGSGTLPATPAQQEEIAGFAAKVYANAMNR